MVSLRKLRWMLVALISFGAGWGVCFATLRRHVPATNRRASTDTGPDASPLLDPRGYLPGEQESLAYPKVNPRDVVLRVENRTGEALHLVMYDCWAHYRPELPYRSLRRHWPLHADSAAQDYREFEFGSGWFALFVVKEQPIHLLTADLFRGPRPKLIIERDSGAFTARLSFPDQDTVD